MNHQSISFFQYLKTPVSGIKPYSIFAVAIITLILGVVDTVGCVVLVISAFVFMKKGHKGLSFLLTLTNFIIPDALPLVDEIAGVVTVVLPMYMDWKNITVPENK